ncbi:MAG TPA: hypothetical protein PK598_11505, partial [Thermoanaerobaculia bacterium]|nr:hypothetical protein [Thermoanaerobaculia bacterium]
ALGDDRHGVVRSGRVDALQSVGGVAPPAAAGDERFEGRRGGQRSGEPTIAEGIGRQARGCVRS